MYSYLSAIYFLLFLSGDYSQVFSSNDTGCRQAEEHLYPDEKSDRAKYDDDDKKKTSL